MAPRRARRGTRRASVRSRRSTQTRWIAVYYKDEDGKAPAREALRAESFPRNVRLALEARAKAIRDAPPPSFPAASQMWSVMTRDREKGRVDMSGIYEIRDKHGDTLYRLFCVLDSDVDSSGLGAPALVMLSLATKQVRTAMPESIYRKVRRQADRYFESLPRPVMLPDELGS